MFCRFWATSFVLFLRSRIPYKQWATLTVCLNLSNIWNASFRILQRVLQLFVNWFLLLYFFFILFIWVWRLSNSRSILQKIWSESWECWKFNENISNSWTKLWKYKENISNSWRILDIMFIMFRSKISYKMHRFFSRESFLILISIYFFFKFINNLFLNN